MNNTNSNTNWPELLWVEALEMFFFLAFSSFCLMPSTNRYCSITSTTTTTSNNTNININKTNNTNTNNIYYPSISSKNNNRNFDTEEIFGKNLSAKKNNNTNTLKTNFFSLEKFRINWHWVVSRFSSRRREISDERRIKSTIQSILIESENISRDQLKLEWEMFIGHVSIDLRSQHHTKIIHF